MRSRTLPAQRRVDDLLDVLNAACHPDQRVARVLEMGFVDECLTKVEGVCQTSRRVCESSAAQEEKNTNRTNQKTNLHQTFLDV